MSEPDAANILFKSYLNESSFSAVHGAQQNDELGDAVKDFIEGRQFAIESGVDCVKLDRETARNDSRFETFLEKRAQIAAGGKKEAVPSPYLYAKRIDVPLGKGEIMSRMLRLVDQLRADCSATELELLEKSVTALDIPCFCQVAESVVSRLKRAA